MPYNYLLEKQYLDNMPVRLENFIIIFDEAHNIEGTAENGSSQDFSLSDLENARSELKLLKDKIENTDNNENSNASKDHVRLLLDPINGISEYFKNLGREIKPNSEGEKGVLKEGRFLFDCILSHTKGMDQKLKNRIMTNGDLVPETDGNGQRKLIRMPSKFTNGLNLVNFEDYLVYGQECLQELSTSIMNR